MIDPGLLRQGQAGAAEARRTAVFSARVAPIPAYGFKRIEIEYHERIPVENLQSYFAIPLRPDAEACERIDVTTVSRLLRESIRRIHNEQSVSSLFV